MDAGDGHLGAPWSDAVWDLVSEQNKPQWWIGVAPCMQGADKVNDELEVGFDEPFESRWSRAEQVGRVVMVLVAAAGLSGLLGR